MKHSFIIIAALLLSSQTAFGQWGQFKSIDPSPAKAKVMTTLDKFTYPDEPQFPTYRDVVYAHRDSMDLHVRIITPGIRSEKPLPCIFFIQGAAWFKQSLDQKLSYLMGFSQRGYVIAMIEHRPSTTAKYPAQIQDVKSAVRFVRENAGRYHIDPVNMFIWGDSSGGNMALLETLTQDVPSLDTPEEYGKQSLAVNACVAFYPVTDVLRMQEFAPDYMDHISANSPTGTLFGHIPVMENPDIVKTVSPIEYVTKSKASSTAPIIIVTGNRDNVVPYEQSVIMADKLEDNGYDYKFYKIEGGDHGSREFWSAEVSGLVDDFFKAHMK
ncbi:MAG: alpha/beta hydrolase [Bacteroidia bacterium]|nr:alpha/beta hydrolase [Bacteroidia bacterium]